MLWAEMNYCLIEVTEAWLEIYNVRSEANPACLNLIYKWVSHKE